MDTLARTMADLAEEMDAAPGLKGTTEVVVRAARTLVPGTEHASVSRAHRGVGIDTIAATGQLPWDADQAQVETGQGPCITAAWEQRVARLEDTAADGRWPAFSRQARALGVGSMLSLQLSAEKREDERIGALNLYHLSPHGFTAEALEVGLIVAAHAAAAVAAAEREDQLREALAGRDVIGQAKGLLMARFGMGAEAAFDVLVRRSRDTNTRLRDVAAAVVQSAGTPEQVAPG